METMSLSMRPRRNDKLIAATVQVGMGKMAGMKMDDSSALPQPK